MDFFYFGAAPAASPLTRDDIDAIRRDLAETRKNTAYLRQAVFCACLIILVVIGVYVLGAVMAAR